MSSTRIEATPEHACLLDAVSRAIYTPIGADSAVGRAPSADCHGAHWENVIELARVHGVIALLQEGTRGHRQEGHGDSYSRGIVFERIAEIHDAELRRSLRLCIELTRVLSRLEAQGVRAVPIKGPLLAHRVYGSIALRSFWDLDILIAPNDFFEAKRVLEDEGYEAENALSSRQVWRELKRNCEYNFDHPEHHIHLELHWRFFPSYVGFGNRTDNVDVILGRTETILFMGYPIPVLNLVDELVALAVHHAVKHAWEQLRMIGDIAAFLARIEDRPVALRSDKTSEDSRETLIGAIIERAEEWGAQRALASGILLVQELLSTPVPGSLLGWAAGDRKARALAERYRSRILMFDGRPDSETIGFTPYKLMLRERRRDQLQYLRHVGRAALLPTDKEHNLLPLPESLRFLYFLVRPVRLLSKYFIRTASSWLVASRSVK